MRPCSKFSKEIISEQFLNMIHMIYLKISIDFTDVQDKSHHYILLSLMLLKERVIKQLLSQAGQWWLREQCL